MSSIISGMRSPQTLIFRKPRLVSMSGRSPTTTCSQRRDAFRNSDRTDSGISSREKSTPKDALATVVGVSDGTSEGASDGILVGTQLGATEGTSDGTSDG